MGYPDGYGKATDAVALAAKKGTWVLLKNVHLSPQWLANLEKRLHRMQPHRKFRLFLTMEINPKVPATLLRKSYVVVFEPPAGIKSSLARTYHALSPLRVDRAPAERSRLYILLAWLHAVLIERLRYHPVGWSKHFEFSETDILRAMDALDEWVDRLGKDRQHVDPSGIPWLALQVMLEQYSYGGRIDNEFDSARLRAFVRHLFSANSFEPNFSLAGVGCEHIFSLPASTTHSQIVEWIDTIDETQSSKPSVLGLPDNAESMLLARRAGVVSQQLLTLQELDSSATDEGSLRRDSMAMAGGGVPTWMVDIFETMKKWIAGFPNRKELVSPPSTPDAVKNPLFRALRREIIIGVNVVDRVFADFASLTEVVEGREKASNDLRGLLTSLRKGQVPPAWSAHYTVDIRSASLWAADFTRRAHQLHAFCTTGYVSAPTAHVWLGGIFQPEALVAATRQVIAQRHQWSLDQLSLVVHIGQSEEKRSADSFAFDGMRLNGASWNSESKMLALSSMSSIGL
eukprot:199703_1